MVLIFKLKVVSVLLFKLFSTLSETPQNIVVIVNFVRVTSQDKTFIVNIFRVTAERYDHSKPCQGNHRT